MWTGKCLWGGLEMVWSRGLGVWPMVTQGPRAGATHGESLSLPLLSACPLLHLPPPPAYHTIPFLFIISSTRPPPILPSRAAN